MATDLTDFAKYLRCPDDGGELLASDTSLNCEKCGRKFPVIGDCIVEMLPSNPATLPFAVVNSRYAIDYRQFFCESANPGKNAMAWGAPELIGKHWEGVHLRHVAKVMAFLRKTDSSHCKTFCDFSGGAGYCTFEAARAYEKVFHCDLSADSLLYSSRKATSAGMSNILFVRADYFAPPFCASVDHVVCLDTLIRGRWHEERLLSSVRSALSNGGAAVVDFHNWWHNPLRRIGLLPQNFPEAGSYTATELKSLLVSSGVDAFEVQPFVQEIRGNGRAARLLELVLPATRFLVRIPGPELRSDLRQSAHYAPA